MTSAPPTSAWQPPSAAEIVLPRLKSIPTACTGIAINACALREARATYRCRQQKRLDAFFRIVANKLKAAGTHVNRAERGRRAAMAPQKRTPTSMMYFKTAGITPAAPLVGEVTMRPPDAFTSLTAIA